MTGNPIILVGFFAVTLAAAAASDTDPSVSAPKQRLICRGATATLGSHIRTPRRCLTEERWREEDEARTRTPISMQVTEGQNDGHAASAPH